MPFIFLAALMVAHRLLERFPAGQLPLKLALLFTATVAATQGSVLSYSNVVARARQWVEAADQQG